MACIGRALIRGIKKMVVLKSVIASWEQETIAQVRKVVSEAQWSFYRTLA